MAPPITWQNINSGTDAGAIRLLENAQSSLNTGLGGLGKLVEAQQNIRNANFNQTRTNNLQAFTDAISKYKTLGEFTAAQESGAIDALRSSLGPNIDNAAVTSLLQGTPDQLMARENALTTFNLNKLKRDADPIAEQVRALTFANKDAEAQQMLSANSKLLADSGNLATLTNLANTQNQAELDQAFQAQNRERTRVGWDRADTDHAFNMQQRMREETNRIAGEDIAAASSSIMANAPDELTARSQIMEWAAKNGIPANIVGQHLAQIAPDYAARYGLTADMMVQQDNEMRFAMDEFNRQAEAHPFDNVFSFANPDRVTEGDASKFLVDELDYLSEDPKQALEYLRKVRKDQIKPEDEGMLGAVLMEAAKLTGKTSVWREDDSALAKSVVEVFDKYLQSQANRAYMEEAAIKRDSTLSGIQTRNKENVLKSMQRRN